MALCTWNGGRWLAQLLASVLSQQRLPDELVVQDDASSDDSVAIVTEFAARAPFEVRLEVNPARVGSTRNFALALARCRGNVVALADQDDVWYPAKLVRLLAELESDPTVTLVFSDADLIGEDGRALGRRLWETRLVAGTLRRHSVVSEELFARRGLTTGCTMAVRRRAAEAALPFPEILDDVEAPMRHDRWLSLVAAAVGTVRALPEPLMGFRVHPSQQTGVLIGAQLRRAFRSAASGAFADSPARTSEAHLIRAAQLDAAAERAEDLGDFKEAGTLRRIAAHHTSRARVGDGSVPRSERVHRILSEVRSGDYGSDPLGAASVTADLVRALRPQTARHP